MACKQLGSFQKWNYRPYQDLIFCSSCFCLNYPDTNALPCWWVHYTCPYTVFQEQGVCTVCYCLPGTWWRRQIPEMNEWPVQMPFQSTPRSTVSQWFPRGTSGNTSRGFFAPVTTIQSLQTKKDAEGLMFHCECTPVTTGKRWRLSWCCCPTMGRRYKSARRLHTLWKVALCFCGACGFLWLIPHWTLRWKIKPKIDGSALKGTCNLIQPSAGTVCYTVPFLNWQGCTIPITTRIPYSCITHLCTHHT